MAAIVIALDGCLLDRVVKALDLTIGPCVLALGEPVFDIIAPTGAIEGMATRQRAVGPSRFSGKSANWMPLSANTLWVV